MEAWWVKKGNIHLCQQKQTTMKTFKNKNFTKRNYECTNIVFCQAETAPDANWIECDSIELELSSCKQLWVQDGVRYFGWL